MRKQLKKILLLSILLLGGKGTVYAQRLTLDSCICYTERQDLRCLECLINAPKKDSIIKDLKEVVKIDSEIVQKHELTIINLRTENAQQADRITTLKKNRKFYLLIGGIVGVLTNFFI